MYVEKPCRLKRMISIVTVLLFVISLFAGCSDEAASSSRQQTSSASQTQSGSASQQENVSSEPSVAPEDYSSHPTLTEKVDLNWLEVIFALETGVQVIPKDDSTETNSEILDSLRRIQKDYNCRISYIQIEYDDWDDIISALAAGEEYADVILPCIHQASVFFEANICADFMSPEISKYIDMSRPWWNDSVMQAANIGGKVYAAAPCISDTVGMASVVLFNKNVLEDIGHESDELYSLYHKGEWTWDALAKYAKKANKDLDKDGKHDGFDDRWGLIGPHDIVKAFCATSGVSAVTVENGKNAAYSLNTEHAIKTLERLNSFFNTEDIFYYTGWDSAVRRDVVMFNDDLALFSVAWFSNIDRLSKDKAGRIGVLPMPLGPDENGGWQKEYVCLGNHNFRVALIPKTVKDKEGKALVLEKLAFDRWKLMYGKFDRVLESIEADEQTVQIAHDIYGYVTFKAEQFLYAYEQYKWNNLTSTVFRDIALIKDYVVKGFVNARANEAQAVLNKYYSQS